MMTLPCLKLAGDSSVPLAKTSPWSLQNRGWGQLLLHSLALIPGQCFWLHHNFSTNQFSDLERSSLALTCQLFAVVKLCDSLTPMGYSTSGFPCPSLSP